jgi:hypothetical protein
MFMERNDIDERSHCMWMPLIGGLRCICVSSCRYVSFFFTFFVALWNDYLELDYGNHDTTNIQQYHTPGEAVNDAVMILGLSCKPQKVISSSIYLRISVSLKVRMKCRDCRVVFRAVYITSIDSFSYICMRSGLKFYNLYLPIPAYNCLFAYLPFDLLSYDDLYTAYYNLWQDI